MKNLQISGNHYQEGPCNSIHLKDSDDDNWGDSNEPSEKLTDVYVGTPY